MTAQISDRFLFKGEDYALIGKKGGYLFSPEHYGMQPVKIGTGCYRGFHATYEVMDDGLYLRQLTIRESQDRYPPIDGVFPIKDNYTATYDNLKTLVRFSGVVRLANDLIPGRYEHMGYQEATSFRYVHDLTFVKGKLVKETDLSDDMTQIRVIQGKVKAFTDYLWINSNYKHKKLFTHRDISMAFSLDIGQNTPDELRSALAELKDAIKKPAWFLANVSDFYETKHTIGENIKFLEYLGLPDDEVDFLKGMIRVCSEKDIVAIFLHSLSSLAGENWTEMTRWVIEKGYKNTPANNKIEAKIIRRIKSASLDIWR